MSEIKLDAEERELLASYEADEWHSVSNAAKRAKSLSAIVRVRPANKKTGNELLIFAGEKNELQTSLKPFHPSN